MGDVTARSWFDKAAPVVGAPASRRLEVDRKQWRVAAEELAAGGGRLISLWPSRERTINAAFGIHQGTLVLTLQLAPTDADYPGLEDLFPAASRLQRAAADLYGLRSTDPDSRPWLRHSTSSYPFVQVEGEGVHEIPVGPVHAGIIEPGHFRFSVVGEKVLRLEERLGYVHKGIERRFTELPAVEGQRLAARVSGDSAVAFSWAYVQALEGIAGASLPARAAWLRALALELERIANHLGDLGALGNDAGFAFGLAQFSRLKEQLLRTTEKALGQRYLMDFIVPGGTRADLAADGSFALQLCITSIAREVDTLRSIYEDHAGLRDRFVGAGCVAPDLAAKLGLTGLAGRASGQAFDLRVDLPCQPYPELSPRKVSRQDGDVAARVAVRFDELLESARLVSAILERLPSGLHGAPLPTLPAEGFGLGCIEGWRGPVLIALETEAAKVRRCHPHDPSWQNWPVLEHAIIGNIVPDFPLINKSFNLSYSGHDL